MFPFFKISSRVSPFFRRRRLAKLLGTFEFTPDLRVLDVGGLPEFWTASVPAKITLLNLTPPGDYQRRLMQPGMEWVVGDGTALAFPDKHFDLVVSNSVIEHVGTFEQQVAFAREVRRVGRQYWVQTPAFGFPIEPHYFGIGIHWLSKPLQRKLLRHGTLWGLINRPEPEIIESALAELRLMKRREVGALFPDAEIWTERVLGLPKSYTAIRRVPSPQPARCPNMAIPRVRTAT